MAKDDAKVQDLANVLYDAAEALRIITILIHPIMPESTEKIWKQLGQPGKLDEERIDKLAWGQLKSGTEIGTVTAVYPRIDHQEAIERSNPWPTKNQSNRTASTRSNSGSQHSRRAAAATAPAASEKSAIEDFAKVECA